MACSKFESIGHLFVVPHLNKVGDMGYWITLRPYGFQNFSQIWNHFVSAYFDLHTMRRGTPSFSRMHFQFPDSRNPPIGQSVRNVDRQHIIILWHAKEAGCPSIHSHCSSQVGPLKYLGSFGYTSWHLMIFHDISWQNDDIYHDMSWHFMAYHELSPTISERWPFTYGY